jgi:hypothetical protein
MFKYNVNWFSTDIYYLLNTVELLREFQNYVDWYLVDHGLINSVELLREFQNQVRWYLIRPNSIEIMREFQHKINWKFIDYSLIDSIDLLKEFKGWLDEELINYILIGFDNQKN